MKGLGYYIRLANTSYKKNKRTFIFYVVLRVLVVITLIRCLFTENYESAWICALSEVLFLLPALVQYKMKLEIPGVFQSIIFAFIFAAEILGEVNHYYVRIPGWDTMLHTMNGFLCAAIGFSLIYLLNRGSKYFNLTPFYMTLVAFCFSMTVGVVWEFFECSMDLFFGMDMQKDFIVTNFNSVTLDPAQMGAVVQVTDVTDTVIHTASGTTYTIPGGYLDIGILDTMKDLFVNLIGAVAFSIIGYSTLKYSKSSKIADSLTIRPVDTEETVVAEEADAPAEAEEAAEADTPAEAVAPAEEDAPAEAAAAAEVDAPAEVEEAAEADAPAEEDAPAEADTPAEADATETEE